MHRKLVRLFSRNSAIWVAVGTVVAAGLSFLFQAYLSLVLGDGDFGDMASVIAFSTALSVFAAGGAQNVMLDAVKSASEDIRSVLSSFARMWILNTCAIGAFSSVVVFLGLVNASTALFVNSFSALFALLVILGSASQADDNFRDVGIYLVSPEMAKMAGLLVIAILGLRSLPDIYLWLGISFFFISAICFFMMMRHFDARSGPSYYSIAREGLPYAFAGLLFMVYYRAVLMIFSAFGLREESGSLAIVNLFMAAILLLPTAYSQRFLLGRWHVIPKDDPRGFVTELRRQLLQSLAFSFPLALLWFFFWDDLLSWLYPSRFGGAIAYGRWFAFVFLLRSLNLTLQTATSVGDLKWRKMWVIALASVLIVGASAALAKPFGMLGGVLASIVAEAFLASGLVFVALARLRTGRG